MQDSDLIAGTVASRDGTSIAYERAGDGPVLILIDAAGHYRAFSSFGGLIRRLVPHFTVYHYDRRGRGDSTDTVPYAVAREVEDLAALIDDAGGSAFLYGYSSGALLALHAAASGLTVPRLALLEPPITTDDDRAEQRAFTAELAELVAAGRDDAAVQHFMASVAPDDVVTGMRDTRPWSAMRAVAHTLVYDCQISEATSPETLAAATVPTLVLDSVGSTDDITGMAATVARGMPNASHQSLPGEWHGVSDDALAPALVSFLRSG